MAFEALVSNDHPFNSLISQHMISQQSNDDDERRYCKSLSLQVKTKRKKKKKKQRVCKNGEEAETQRMTHIAVERNRRKQMNDYLSVLRSLMPESFIQRGDQASIVGGAIDFVKRMEQLLQSLEVQKLLQKPIKQNDDDTNFWLPRFPQSQIRNKYTSITKSEIADVEVTLIEKHANFRILSKKRYKQLLQLVTGFQTLQLTILHINVTAVEEPLVLYSISAKVEDECQLKSVEDIANAVHHMLRIIEENVLLGLGDPKTNTSFYQNTLVST